MANNFQYIKLILYNKLLLRLSHTFYNMTTEILKTFKLSPEFFYYFSLIKFYSQLRNRISKIRNFFLFITDAKVYILPTYFPNTTTLYSLNSRSHKPLVLSELTCSHRNSRKSITQITKAMEILWSILVFIENSSNQSMRQVCVACQKLAGGSIHNTHK